MKLISDLMDGLVDFLDQTGPKMETMILFVVFWWQWHVLQQHANSEKVSSNPGGHILEA